MGKAAVDLARQNNHYATIGFSAKRRLRKKKRIPYGWVFVLIGSKFASSIQKQYPDLGSFAPSDWNSCARSLDVILLGN